MELGKIIRKPDGIPLDSIPLFSREQGDRVQGATIRFSYALSAAHLIFLYKIFFYPTLADHLNFL
jgi:hypothetical protein